LIGSPVKVPETLLVAGAAVVFVADGVGDALCVAAGEVVAAALLLGVALFVATGLLVSVTGEALFVATGAADGDSDVVVVVVVAGAISEPRDNVLSEEVSCGGVIAKTAPSPPTVPPAINNARFMP
jgi:hypothetical protein